MKIPRMIKNEKLKQARIKADISQKTMGEYLQISTLSYLLKENGDRPFTEWEIMMISEILKVSPLDLFFGEWKWEEN